MKNIREWKNKRNKKIMAAISVMDPNSQYSQTKTIKVKIGVGADVAYEINSYIVKEREQGREPTSYRLPYFKYECLADYLTSRLRPIYFSEDSNGLPEFALYRGIRLMPY